MIERSKPIFTIDRKTLEHLPPMHRLAAEYAIKDGRWKLIENTDDEPNKNSSSKND